MVDQPRGMQSAINNLGADASKKERVGALVQTISAYIEHYHGGAVEMVDFKDDRLTVRLLGACEGCDLAPVTLHGWISGTVHQFFPEVEVAAGS